MSDDFDPTRHRWTWLVLVIFFLTALFAALWIFSEAKEMKQHHRHNPAPTVTGVSTNRN